jgi:hypothetical protein
VKTLYLINPRAQDYKRNPTPVKNSD